MQMHVSALSSCERGIMIVTLRCAALRAAIQRAVAKWKRTLTAQRNRLSLKVTVAQMSKEYVLHVEQRATDACALDTSTHTSVNLCNRLQPAYLSTYSDKNKFLTAVVLNLGSRDPLGVPNANIGGPKRKSGISTNFPQYN